jgi:hypothetical protein
MKVLLSSHHAGATLACGVVLGLVSTGILAPVGDDLDRADAARGRTRDKLDPDPLLGLLRNRLPGRHGTDDDPADDPHLLPDPRKQHAGVNPASA